MIISTITDVLNELERILDVCRKKSSRQGYFAALYRLMTQAVKIGIDEGRFQNASRMEKLDVIFAKRYITAWNCYQLSEPCSRSWKSAFDACEETHLAVIQHLLLGINTHINLDLSIAAAETSPGESIFDLQADFEKINMIIATLTGEVQLRLEKIWWPMVFLKKIAHGRENSVVDFSITAARKASWANAVALASASGGAETRYIKGIDNTVDRVAGRIIKPGFVTRLILKPVHWFEYKNVVKTIDTLAEPVAGRN